MARDKNSIWREWYAWHPVLTVDDGLAWLEIVWRRKPLATGRWQYRTFRPGSDRGRESQDREEAGRGSW